MGGYRDNEIIDLNTEKRGNPALLTKTVTEGEIIFTP